VDLVAAKDCAGCGGVPQRRSPLCGRCLETIAAERPRRIVAAATGVPRGFAVAGYEDPVRSMLIAYKERGRSDLRPVLGRALACAVAEALAGVPAGPGVATSVLLVPVPSTRSSVRHRGADTTGDLARTAARLLREAAGLEIRAVPALRHVRAVADQAGLVYAERAANLAGALDLRRRGMPRPRAPREAVILVDDIVTSGASLAEAARALRARGTAAVAAAAVAAARSRR
jgi:predicted amidophosphoribosyltransferase